MKYFLFLFLIFILLGTGVSYAQQQSGAQTMRLARSIYEQGRLHEIPDLINKNLTSFSKSELVDAYRLLTLSYIYLEEPEKADESMQKLLQTDPFFEPNKDVETAEFMGLYKTFRTKPVFSIGVRAGVNGTQPLLKDIYYVASGAQGHGKYSNKIAFQYGLVFEKEIFDRSKKAFLRRVTFDPELLLTSRSFKYSNPSFYTQDADPSAGAATFDGQFTQSYLDFNPLFQLRMNNSKTLITYVGFGPGISYLTKATATLVLTRNGGVGGVSGPDVQNSKSFSMLVGSVIATAGVKYKFGSIFLNADGRIQYGFNSPVNSSKRTEPESVFDYSYTLPNYRPLTVMVNLGFIYPYFNPIKLKRKPKK
jgi:hypothetical protein